MMSWNTWQKRRGHTLSFERPKLFQPQYAAFDLRIGSSASEGCTPCICTHLIDDTRYHPYLVASNMPTIYLVPCTMGYIAARQYIVNIRTPPCAPKMCVLVWHRIQQLHHQVFARITEKCEKTHFSQKYATPQKKCLPSPRSKGQVPLQIGGFLGGGGFNQPLIRRCFAIFQIGVFGVFRVVVFFSFLGVVLFGGVFWGYFFGLFLFGGVGVFWELRLAFLSNLSKLRT